MIRLAAQQWARVDRIGSAMAQTMHMWQVAPQFLHVPNQ